MRLGPKLMIVGLLLTIPGVLMSAGHYEEETTYTGLYQIETQTEWVENPLKPAFLWAGNMLFVGGFGGWIGTYDSEQRKATRQKTANDD
jgi:hypothetical protein